MQWNQVFSFECMNLPSLLYLMNLNWVTGPFRSVRLIVEWLAPGSDPSDHWYLWSVYFHKNFLASRNLIIYLPEINMFSLLQA